jgi:hypothetical protein
MFEYLRVQLDSSHRATELSYINEYSLQALLQKSRSGRADLQA